VTRPPGALDAGLAIKSGGEMSLHETCLRARQLARRSLARIAEDQAKYREHEVVDIADDEPHAKQNRVWFRQMAIEYRKLARELRKRAEEK